MINRKDLRKLEQSIVCLGTLNRRHSSLMLHNFEQDEIDFLEKNGWTVYTEDAYTAAKKEIRGVDITIFLK